MHTWFSPKQVGLIGLVSLVSATLGFAATVATMQTDTQTISIGERASFPVKSSASGSSEFSGWCELKTGGAASVVFDGRHYIPLSEPAVGDVINFNGPGERRFEMTGTFEANDGASEISFFFSNVPVAFCFGGGDCATVSEASAAVTVSCGQY